MRRIAEVLFGFYLLAVPLLNLLPDSLCIPAIGTNYSRILLLSLIALTACLVVRESQVVGSDSWILIWFGLYLGWRLICLLHGFGAVDIWVPEGMSRTWLLIKHVKRVVCDDILILIPMTYYLFRNNPGMAVTIFCRSLLVLGVILVSYALFEMIGVYWKVEWVRSCMACVANHMWPVEKFNGWWPPALWPEQRLRSLTQEPSYFAILLLFIVPIAVAAAKKNVSRIGRIWLSLLVFASLCCIWLTQSRTAVVGLALEVIIFIAIVIVGMRSWRCRFAYIAGAVAVLTASYFAALSVARCTPTEYVHHNVETVACVDARSNTARLTSLMAHLEVGVKHPIMGVGPLLLPYNLRLTRAAQESQNPEVQLWSRSFRPDCWKSGKSGMPSLCLYAKVLADSGVVGLLLFLTIPLIVAIRFIRQGLPEDPRVVLLGMLTLVGGALICSDARYIEYDLVMWGLLLILSTNSKNDGASTNSL